MRDFEGFSDDERAYLQSQRLGRMATVDPQGQPQVNPVGFFPQDDGTVLVGGLAMGRTKKWRNLRTNPKVALVVDDLASVRPWQVRGVEIRGEAELLVGPHGLGPHFSEEVIRIHPHRIHSWGLPGPAEATAATGPAEGRSGT
ncbi:PPOX class F420-dependent oxidoreductase [Streptomyces sp. ISL-36]|uniref:PPOX class F420-dependent oxidoreductase n=1 Tax=Streptomyces sp. ISL-36 TaxID=2819182 RepID=UPI001BE7108F|nr:PPOX class F420-dependent oxidoreductase [Streptomyces sp. ISL-36]MBT2444973.1 PPOX class F420-dependent oxidoreductase [Streptomyces sp. ISL-36]